MKECIFSTNNGKYLFGDSIKLIQNKLLRYYRNKINLIITSPPFPLNKKKRYGNLIGEQYKKWFLAMSPLYSELITNDGSIVIELGNTWEPGRPVQSLLHLESLIEFVKHPVANLRLCQEFICYNPTRLPSPAQWVTIERTRAIDSYTHIWWMSKSDNPKADNTKVLRPYSKSMEEILRKKVYNSGKRPSQHKISKAGFLKDQKGSIMPNFIQIESMHEKDEIRLPENVLRLSNTMSFGYYFDKCRELGIQPHPARMNPGLISFFIEFLTDSGDLVLDPFAGTNTTGYVAELLGRKWIGIEIKQEYAKQALFRFEDPQLNSKINVIKIF